MTQIRLETAIDSSGGKERLSPAVAKMVQTQTQLIKKLDAQLRLRDERIAEREDKLRRYRMLHVELRLAVDEVLMASRSNTPDNGEMEQMSLAFEDLEALLKEPGNV